MVKSQEYATYHLMMLLHPMDGVRVHYAQLSYLLETCAIGPDTTCTLLILWGRDKEPFCMQKLSSEVLASHRILKCTMKLI